MALKPLEIIGDRDDLIALQNMITRYGIRSTLHTIATICDARATEAGDAGDRERSYRWDRTMSAINRCVGAIEGIIVGRERF